MRRNEYSKGLFMRITMRPMTADEAWNFILRRHHYFHTELKKFEYGISSFVPSPKNNPIIKEMFDKEKLTDEDIEKYGHFFKHKIYNVNDLIKYDDVMKSYVIPMMERGINKFLIPLLKSWNATIPNELEILCTYGQGAAYSSISDKKAQIIFRMSRYPDNQETMLNTMLHEFIHILIQKPIIEKYNVPHNFKERIVDIIGTEFFGDHIQERFISPFVDKYITPETIKTDLPGAAAKMMTDYNALQQKQAQER